MNETTDQRIRILVVDDNSIDRKLLSHHLEGLNCSVTQAENGRQAMQLLSSGEFDVVILDLLMPEMDGFETLKRLKVNSTLQHIPVIVISAMEDMESVTRCIGLGAIDHLSKPFDPVLLRARIKAALAVKWLDEENERKRLAIVTAHGTETEAAARAEVGQDEEEPKVGILGLMRCLLHWMRPYRRQAILIGFLLLISVTISSAIPLGFKYITDYGLIPHDLKALVIILAIMGAAEVVSTATDIGRDFYYARFIAKLLNDLRFNMFRHLQVLSMKFYGRVSAGDITSRFGTDLAAVDNALTMCLQGAVCQVLSIVITLVLLFTLEWRLALLATIGLYLSFRAEHAVEPRAQKAGLRMKEQQGNIAAVLQENVQAQPVVKMFRLQSMVIERFKRQMVDFYHIAARACFMSYLTYRVPDRCVSLFGLLVIAGGSFLVYHGSLTIGALVAFQMLLSSLNSSASELTWSLPQLLQAGVGMERIEGLLNEKADITDAPDATPLPRPTGEIAMDKVSFGYAADRFNLNDVTMKIPTGQSVLLVGPSGCGKSTVLNLLMRFYDSTAGSVSIDGRDVRTTTQDSLRGHMSAVLQENFLFNESIRENIRMGNREARDEEVEAAAMAAEIHDVIMKMPQGYDTAVGEGGGKLSGGQRQRIAIARAILSNPAILLLDEATSALDPATAASINDSLEHLGKGRTVISVTHRLEAAPKADGIFVFREGRLVENGRHDDLLKMKGVYAQLWNKQSGFSISEDGTQACVDAARLRDVPILSELDEATLGVVAGLFVTEHFAPRRLVVQQGDSGDKFYILVRGRVSVVGAEPSGEEKPLAVLEDGDHFGEVALMRRIPRTASVRTLTDCILLSLQREHFLRLVEANPQLKQRLEEITTLRTRSG